ncbi:MAG: hypothetical protein WAU82_10275 [Candidatus Binatus sp.]|uniref:hypothetical protein n=1 Tax=Candidatus Binatus sp. TaxID=2811406 RepID=UPI003BAE700F
MLAPIVVKRRDDGWEFVPSTTLASLMIGGFVAGSALYLYLSTYFIRSANTLFGVTLLLAGVLIAAMAIRAWRTRNTPLNVKNGGRVSYGEQELCAAGTVRSVRIVPSFGGEVGDCEVRLELADGSQVAIPSQYFAGFKSSEHAKPFAKEFAKALGVQVSESH